MISWFDLYSVDCLKTKRYSFNSISIICEIWLSIVAVDKWLDKNNSPKLSFWCCSTRWIHNGKFSVSSISWWRLVIEMWILHEDSGETCYDAQVSIQVGCVSAMLISQYICGNCFSFLENLLVHLKLWLLVHRLRLVRNELQNAGI